ncbi:MAG: MFS transporter [Bacteroidia bacterium]
MSKNPAKEVLKIKSFRAFLGTRLFLTLGFQMQAVLVGWRIFELTKNPLSLGLIGLAEAIPALSVALYAGHLADIKNKKKILVICLLGLIVSSIGLFIGNSLLFDLDNSTRVYFIYFFIFTSGIARGFYAPSSFSLIPKLVPKEILVNAGTINSTVWQFAAVVGPALGGMIYGFAGIDWSFGLIILFMLIGLYQLINVHGDFSPSGGQSEGIILRLKEGIGFVFSNKVVLSALSLDLFSVLFGGAVALLPIFADEILKVGPQGLGILRAAPSFGAVITMSLLSIHKSIPQPGKVLIAAVAGFGLCMIGFGLSESYILSIVLLFLSGAFDSVSVVIRSNILQLQTPDHMRGRVSAVNTMFIGSSNEIGAFESGLAAKLLGTVPSVVFGGMMTLAIVGFTQVKARALKNLRFD